MHVRRHISWCCTAALVAALLPARAAATQVEALTVPQLADLAGQVMVGHVVGVHSYWADHPRRIESLITFESVEYLKGALPDADGSYSLIVPGGTVGDTTLRLSGAPEWTIGDSWLLFVLPTYKLHPIAGVYRGALRIVEGADGVARVFDADRHVVTGIEGTGHLRIAECRATAPAPPASDAGIAVATPPADHAVAEPAITWTEFRAALMPILGASREFHLTAPAGQRVAVRYTPVPLGGQSNRPIEADQATPRGAGGSVPVRNADDGPLPHGRGSGRHLKTSTPPQTTREPR